ncbi:hypothetical protein Tco_0745542 [Tanacetum coccineum]
MAEPNMFDNMEIAPTGSNLSITSNDINIELSNEFLVELRKNIYHGAYNEDVVDHIAKCMTRSSTNELFTPYKEPEREFRSSKRHFKTLSLDELRSPDFNLLSDQEYLEEEEAEAMAETRKPYMSKTQRTMDRVGVARLKMITKINVELKGQFP